MGDLDLPFEGVPDGPVERDDDYLVCGGVVVSAAVVAGPGDRQWPALVFDFKTAEGGTFPPILLAVPPEGMAPLAELMKSAMAAALKAALR